LTELRALKPQVTQASAAAAAAAALLTLTPPSELQSQLTRLVQQQQKALNQVLWLLGRAQEG